MNDYDFKKISSEVISSISKRDDYFCDLTTQNDKKYYVLGMFPYPSGKAHMGHVRVYTLVDVMARYKKAHGYQVLNPIGWDAFGLPAENAAIKNNTPPDTWTSNNIENMKTEQFSRLGCCFDWNKEINSCSPDYYRWTQWLFLQFYRYGKAYKKNDLVNWCPTDSTVLANEQVIDGKCWRDDTPIEKRNLEQWFLKTTDYADALWQDISKLTEWPNEALAMQKNWIKKSQGAIISFSLTQLSEKIEVFSTRPDTLFGVSALVLAPEHPLLEKLQQVKHSSELADYIQNALKKNAMERTSAKTKTGIMLTFTVQHPFTQVNIPIYVADYVIGSYGTGAVMCVPCHDLRDAEFAQQYNLSQIEVIISDQPLTTGEIFTQDGVLINSGEFTNLSSVDARNKIVARLTEMGCGKAHTIFNLRDWSISRQRYWGCPIPIIICAKCGNVPVPEQDLPVVLPTSTSFSKGKPEYHAEYLHVKCPICHGDALRETDTLDTFFCSSWYAFRFIDPHNEQLVFDSKLVNQWMPIDFYVGGIEHSAQHMIYFRFFTKFLNEIGLLSFSEPVKEFFCNGMVLKDGTKMSKSKGNVVIPSDIIEQYGIDALRLYILGDTPASLDIDWNDRGIDAKFNLLRKIFRAITDYLRQHSPTMSTKSTLTQHEEPAVINFYTYIEKLDKSILRNEFHNVIARWHELSNLLLKLLPNPGQLTVNNVHHMIKDYLIVASLIIPEMTEWLYNYYFDHTGIYRAEWPNLIWLSQIQINTLIVIQINGKKLMTIEAAKDIDQHELEKLLAGHAKVKSTLSNLQVTKKVFVPNRIINYIGEKIA